MTLSTIWALTAAGGVSAIFFTPATIESELGTYLTFFWGGVVAVASVVALLGVALDRYRLEWAAAWFAAGGLSLYAGVVWWLISTGNTTRLTQAFMVSALLLHTVYRALLCAAHARKLRAEHTDTGIVDVIRS